MRGSSGPWCQLSSYNQSIKNDEIEEEVRGSYRREEGESKDIVAGEGKLVDGDSALMVGLP
jgi:hypothetical protein